MRTLFAALAVSALAAPASALVVDSFDLDVTSAAGTNSILSLDAGVNYLLTVSGTAQIGFGGRLADAEFYDVQNPTPSDANASGDIGVWVDGADIDFGAYNPSHVYSALITGAGSTINVFFRDSGYGDNAGFLSVEISSVPVPAGAALLISGLGLLGAARRRQS